MWRGQRAGPCRPSNLVGASPTLRNSRSAAMSKSAFARGWFAAAAVAWMAMAAGHAPGAGHCADQQRRQSVSRHPRLGAAHAGEKAVGRVQRRRHRPGRQDRVGDRPLLAGDRAGLSRHQGQPDPPFRRIRQGDQELRRRNVRVAARHPCRSRRQCVGDRRARGDPRRAQEVSGRGQKGQRGRQVQSRRQGADDAGQAGREGKSAGRADRSQRRHHRSRQRRHLRGREPYQRRGSQSHRAHLGVRPQRQVPAHHRQDRNRARASSARRT